MHTYTSILHIMQQFLHIFVHFIHHSRIFMHNFVLDFPSPLLYIYNAPQLYRERRCHPALFIFIHSEDFQYERKGHLSLLRRS